MFSFIYSKNNKETDLSDMIESFNNAYSKMEEDGWKH